MTATLFDPPLASHPSVRLILVPTPGPGPSLVAPEVYRRRRLGVLAVVIGLLLGVASFGRQADAIPNGEMRSADAIVVIVQPGDTLWDIARSFAPESDPRPLVSMLADLAGSSSLHPGQELMIPLDLVD